MARYDKYDPISGGFRAPLAENLVLVNGNIGPVGVSLDANGRVVVGTAGQSGLVGVLVKNAPKTGWGPTDHGSFNPTAPIGCMAGDIVDVMTAGEIVEVEDQVAGSALYAGADGTLSAAASADGVGYTVEATRLVVRVAASPGL